MGKAGFHIFEPDSWAVMKATHEPATLLPRTSRFGAGTLTIRSGGTLRPRRKPGPRGLTVAVSRPGTLDARGGIRCHGFT